MSNFKKKTGTESVLSSTHPGAGYWVYITSDEIEKLLK